MAEKRIASTFFSGTAEIYYEIYGKGKPLVLLHGNHQSIHECFDAQIEEFSKYYKVIAMDSRGHGKSAAGDDPLTISILAEDVMELLNHLKIDKTYVVGFDDGGNMAMRLCVLYPDSFMGVVLSGANSNYDGIKLKYLFPMWLKQIKNLFVAMWSYSSVLEREIFNLKLKFREVRSFRLSEIECPVLITAGDNDMIRTDHTKRMASFIKGSELHIFPDSDHFVHMKKPEEYNSVVLEFLKKH